MASMDEAFEAPLRRLLFETDAAEFEPAVPTLTAYEEEAVRAELVWAGVARQALAEGRMRLEWLDDDEASVAHGLAAIEHIQLKRLTDRLDDPVTVPWTVARDPTGRLRRIAQDYRDTRQAMSRNATRQLPPHLVAMSSDGVRLALHAYDVLARWNVVHHDPGYLGRPERQTREEGFWRRHALAAEDALLARHAINARRMRGTTPFAPIATDAERRSRSRMARLFPPPAPAPPTAATMQSHGVALGNSILDWLKTRWRPAADDGDDWSWLTYVADEPSRQGQGRTRPQRVLVAEPLVNYTLLSQPRVRVVSSTLDPAVEKDAAARRLELITAVDEILLSTNRAPDPITEGDLKFKSKCIALIRRLRLLQQSRHAYDTYGIFMAIPRFRQAVDFFRHLFPYTTWDEYAEAVDKARKDDGLDVSPSSEHPVAIRLPRKQGDQTYARSEMSAPGSLLFHRLAVAGLGEYRLKFILASLQYLLVARLGAEVEGSPTEVLGLIGTLSGMTPVPVTVKDMQTNDRVNEFLGGVFRVVVTLTWTVRASYRQPLVFDLNEPRDLEVYTEIGGNTLQPYRLDALLFRRTPGTTATEAAARVTEKSAVAQLADHWKASRQAMGRPPIRSGVVAASAGWFTYVAKQLVTASGLALASGVLSLMTSRSLMAGVESSFLRPWVGLGVAAAILIDSMFRAEGVAASIASWLASRPPRLGMWREFSGPGLAAFAGNATTTTTTDVLRSLDRLLVAGRACALPVSMALKLATDDAIHASIEFRHALHAGLTEAMTSDDVDTFLAANLGDKPSALGSCLYAMATADKDVYARYRLVDAKTRLEGSDELVRELGPSAWRPLVAAMQARSNDDVRSAIRAAIKEQTKSPPQQSWFFAKPQPPPSPALVFRRIAEASETLLATSSHVLQLPRSTTTPEMMALHTAAIEAWTTRVMPMICDGPVASPAARAACVNARTCVLYMDVMASVAIEGKNVTELRSLTDGAVPLANMTSQALVDRLVNATDPALADARRAAGDVGWSLDNYRRLEQLAVMERSSTSTDTGLQGMLVGCYARNMQINAAALPREQRPILFTNRPTAMPLRPLAAAKGADDRTTTTTTTELVYSGLTRVSPVTEVRDSAFSAAYLYRLESHPGDEAGARKAGEEAVNAMGRYPPFSYSRSEVRASGDAYAAQLAAVHRAQIAEEPKAVVPVPSSNNATNDTTSTITMPPTHVAQTTDVRSDIDNLLRHEHSRALTSLAVTLGHALSLSSLLLRGLAAVARTYPERQPAINVSSRDPATTYVPRSAFAWSIIQLDRWVATLSLETHVPLAAVALVTANVAQYYLPTTFPLGQLGFHATVGMSSWLLLQGDAAVRLLLRAGMNWSLLGQLRLRYLIANDGGNRAAHTPWSARLLALFPATVLDKAYAVYRFGPSATRLWLFGVGALATLRRWLLVAATTYAFTPAHADGKNAYTASFFALVLTAATDTIIPSAETAPFTSWLWGIVFWPLREAALGVQIGGGATLSSLVALILVLAAMRQVGRVPGAITRWMARAAAAFAGGTYLTLFMGYAPVQTALYMRGHPFSQAEDWVDSLIASTSFVVELSLWQYWPIITLVVPFLRDWIAGNRREADDAKLFAAVGAMTDMTPDDLEAQRIVLNGGHYLPERATDRQHTPAFTVVAEPRLVHALAAGALLLTNHGSSSSGKMTPPLATPSPRIGMRYRFKTHLLNRDVARARDAYLARMRNLPYGVAAASWSTQEHASAVARLLASRLATWTRNARLVWSLTHTPRPAS